MKKWYLFTGVFMLAMVLTVVSCKKNSDNPEPTNGLDRKPMLENYANNYIVPAYADMLAKLESLQTSVADFTQSPDAFKLSQVQNELFFCYMQWQAVAMYEFGPAEESALRTYMNTYPVTISKLNNNITTGSYNLEEFGSKDAQGLPAVDYLVNGLALDMYINDAQAANRKKYLQDVVSKMIEKVSEVNNKWSTHKNTFTENTGTDANSSTSRLVNGIVLYYERYLRSGKIGIPVGAMTGSPLPENTESLYAPEDALKYAVAALINFKSFYKGGSSASLQSYLAALDIKDNNGVLLSTAIENELTEATDKLSELNGSLVDNINNNKTEVLKAYDELQDVVPLLKVDMVSALSISITYTDNDGD